MAYFRIQLYVNALRRQASFEMLIPNDMHVEAPVGEAIQPAKQLKTLFLLHGYTAAPATGCRRSSPRGTALPS